nr:hypothetical protein [Tanacetum cinerariifolium]
MESCDPIGTPMEIKDKLDLDHNGTPVDVTKYRSMIGALMYLMSSRPDIVHTTCLCARYQAKPTEKHLKEVKRIFRYLQGTVNMGLWYTKDYGFELTGFLDVDYAGWKDTFKTYVSLSACYAQVLWMRTQLTDYGFHFNKIPIYCDSKSAIAISCNPVQHSRTKHIAVRYHFIKEHMEKGTIELYFVKTDYQLADIFTKALPADHFNYLVRPLVDEELVIPLDEVKIDDRLHFIEELVEIMDREVKQLKKSRISIVKVRWNSMRGPKYTWEREDQMWKKYPHLFDFNKKQALR